MKRANADIYYYNLGDLALGQIVMWAHLNKRKVVYSVASEFDCLRSIPALKPFRERFLYKHGLKHADEIIVQTGRQQTLLKDEFDLGSTVVPMACEGFGGDEQINRVFPSDIKKRVLWIGRLSPEKRLEWLLDAAETCSDLVFDVVGEVIREKHSGTLHIQR